MSTQHLSSQAGSCPHLLPIQWHQLFSQWHEIFIPNSVLLSRPAGIEEERRNVSLDVSPLSWCKCEFVKVSLVKGIINLENMLIFPPDFPNLGISPGEISEMGMLKWMLQRLKGKKKKKKNHKWNTITWIEWWYSLKIHFPDFTSIKMRKGEGHCG